MRANRKLPNKRACWVRAFPAPAPGEASWWEPWAPWKPQLRHTPTCSSWRIPRDHNIFREPHGNPQTPASEPQGTPGDSREPQGIPGDPRRPHGDPREFERSQGTPGDPRERVGVCLESRFARTLRIFPKSLPKSFPKRCQGELPRECAQ